MKSPIVERACDLQQTAFAKGHLVDSLGHEDQAARRSIRVSVRDHPCPRVIALQDRLETVVRGHALANEDRTREEIAERARKIQRTRTLNGECVPHRLRRVGSNDAKSPVVSDGA